MTNDSPGEAGEVFAGTGMAGRRHTLHGTTQRLRMWQGPLVDTAGPDSRPRGDENGTTVSRWRRVPVGFGSASGALHQPGFRHSAAPCPALLTPRHRIWERRHENLAFRLQMVRRLGNGCNEGSSRFLREFVVATSLSATCAALRTFSVQEFGPRAALDVSRGFALLPRRWLAMAA